MNTKTTITKNNKTSLKNNKSTIEVEDNKPVATVKNNKVNTTAKNNKSTIEVEDSKPVTIVKINKANAAKNNKPVVNVEAETPKKVPAAKKITAKNTKVENTEIKTAEKPITTKKQVATKNNKVATNVENNNVTTVEKPIASKKPVATKKPVAAKNNKISKSKDVEEKKEDEDHKVVDVTDVVEVVENNEGTGEDEEDEEDENNHEFTEEEEEIAKNYNEIDAELQHKHMVYMNTTPEDISDNIGIFNLWQQIDMFARNIAFWDLEFDNLPEPVDIKSATRIVMVTESQKKSRDIVESKFSEFIGQRIMERAANLYNGEKKLKELRGLTSTSNKSVFSTYAIKSYQ